MNVYILGPMRGKPLYNFPDFDEAAYHVRWKGHDATNPADLDRKAGFDPSTLPEDHDWSKLPAGLDQQGIIERDLKALRNCNAYVALEGWENSVGARAEKGLLDWQGAIRLDPETLQPWSSPIMTKQVKKACDEILARLPEGDVNPKDKVGRSKPQLHLVPPALEIWVAKAMENGASRYGAYNWRSKKVSLSCYVSAAKRHLLAYWDGEETASDSGLPHLAHAAACLGIIMDAQATNCLVDDRPEPGAAGRLIEQLTAKP
jgi:hypothetical protein